MKKLLTTLCAFALIAGATALPVNAEEWTDPNKSDWQEVSDQLDKEKSEKEMQEAIDSLKPEGSSDYQNGLEEIGKEADEKI